MNDDKSNNIDAKMYAAYSCIDCGQVFESRQEQEDHKPSISTKCNERHSCSISRFSLIFN
jgi:DNA-directed RNA polymerase subunit RPC12/RpoP